MIETILGFHLVVCFIMALFPAYYIYLLYFEQNFIKLAKSLKYWTPAYMTALAVIIFSGIIAMFMGRFFSDPGVYLMILASLVIIIYEIKRRKKQKPIRSFDTVRQKEFRGFAKRKYLFDLAVIAAFVAVYA